MAKKKTGSKLPSGNVRVQVLDYVDNFGKRHYQSFTAETKTKAQALANEWKYNRKQLRERRTVINCVEEYIDLKRNVMSPTTIRGYDSIAKKLPEYDIAKISVRDLKNSDMQRLVSQLAVGHSQKTIKNYCSLITAAVAIYEPSFSPKYKLPAKKKSELYTPTNEDIQALLDHCRTTEEKLGILFGAICFMRLSEACAVTFADVDFKKKEISINKAMVRSNSGFVTKDTNKTDDSTRVVSVNDDILKMIKSLHRISGTVLDMDPARMYKSFALALKKAELHSFRYHDLRHHAASYAHAMGISDRYIEKMGGWSVGSSVLKRVYENIIDQELVKAKETFLENQQFSV